MARELGKFPLELLNQPFDEFIYNLECVQLSCEEESKQVEQIKKESKSGSGKQMDFDDWTSQVKIENAKSHKARKYGIKSK